MAPILRLVMPDIQAFTIRIARGHTAECNRDCPGLAARWRTNHAARMTTKFNYLRAFTLQPQFHKYGEQWRTRLNGFAARRVLEFSADCACRRFRFSSHTDFSLVETMVAGHPGLRRGARLDEATGRF